MPAIIARQFCDDPRIVYSTYETLVGSGLRRPAASEDDRRRAAVGGALFGTYAAKIRYGVLSLTGEGLPTYGHVYCRLKQIAVMDRVSFLEKNSYVFVQERLGAHTSGIPLGHRAVWENRHELAVAKLAEALAPGHAVADWQALLARSDGKNRAEDDFIEAHIFDGFDVQAVEAMQMAPRAFLSRQQRRDAQLALESLGKREGGAEESA